MEWDIARRFHGSSIGIQSGFVPRGYCEVSYSIDWGLRKHTTALFYRSFSDVNRVKFFLTMWQFLWRWADDGRKTKESNTHPSITSSPYLMRGFGFCSEPLSPASSSIGESALSAALEQCKKTINVVRSFERTK